MGTDGEETAPKRAASHSAFKVSTVLEGKAAPVRWNVSKPADSGMKENERPREEGRAWRSLWPAGITSLPMPSPGMRPNVC